VNSRHTNGRTTRRDHVALNYTRARRITGRVAVLLAPGALATLVAASATAYGSTALAKGWSALVEEDYAGAAQHLSVAVEDSPNDWKPHLCLGWAYAEGGDPSRVCLLLDVLSESGGGREGWGESLAPKWRTLFVIG
jgi:Flp pilus assembly protein TadD